jgi:DNA-binding beta-propeller fold protein YncE
VTNKIYVVDSGDGTLCVIDGAKDVAGTPFSVGTKGGNPAELAINPVSNKIYVSNQVDGTVAVVDGAQPGPIAINPATNKIYVASYGDGVGSTLMVVDGTNNSAPVFVPTGSGPFDVVVNPTTNQIYVANKGTLNINISAGTVTGNGNTVTVIDGMSNTSVATLTVDLVSAFLHVGESRDKQDLCSKRRSK